MATPLTVLDTIAIAIPCTESWDGMSGDDRVRFCPKCSKHVHDISRLTTTEAIDLLKVESRLPCIRLYRRPDGRVLTADCTKSWRGRSLKWLKRSVAAAASLFGISLMTGCENNPCRTMGAPAPTPATGQSFDKPQTTHSTQR
jgi:hypothetical protein